MYRKTTGFFLAVALAILPPLSIAQERSFKDIYPPAYPNGSLVIVSEVPTEVRGYVQTRYAYIDDKCGAVLVDRYGQPVPYDDQRLQELKREEQRNCTEAGTDIRDGE